MLAREYTGTLYKVIAALAVVATLYHILYVAHILDYFGIYIMDESHRGFHVASVLALILLLFPATKRASRKLLWYNIVLILASVIVPLYVGFTYQANYLRWIQLAATDTEIILGIITVLLLFEAARRVIGLAMPLIAAIFVAYAMYGNYVPGFLNHVGFDPKVVFNIIVYGDQGIFGFITGISGTLVIMFILFGQFLLVSGGGEFFIKLAYALMGKYRGGPAKVAIVASCLFGMISGATTANIVTTGTLTIPLMKRVGYKPNFAGAVEAVASNGGQFTPPVMGAVAFIMAEWLEIPYWNICLAAAIPALLYYISLYIFIDIEAMRLQLRGLQPSEIPSLKETLKEGWIFILPVAVLLYFIAVLRYSPETSVLYSLAVVIIVSMFRKETRMNPKRLAEGLRAGMVNGLQAYAACITAGVILAAIMLTGLGPKLTSAILAVSGESLFVILAMAAMASFVFGMGMATMAIYLILATLVAPALAEIGIPPLAAHLFVFWWGLTYFITPPVATGVFVACAISGGEVWKTGLTAMRLAILTYVLPFLWIYHPALILMGSPVEIITTVCITLVLVLVLGYAIAGFMLRWWLRALLAVSAALLLTYSGATVIMGAIIAVVVVVLHMLIRRRIHSTQRTVIETIESDNNRLQ